MLIQGEVHTQPNESFVVVEEDSLRIYPVIGDKILPAAPSLLDDDVKLMIARRLSSIVRSETLEEND